MISPRGKYSALFATHEQHRRPLYPLALPLSAASYNSSAFQWCATCYLGGCTCGVVGRRAGAEGGRRRGFVGSDRIGWTPARTAVLYRGEVSSCCCTCMLHFAMLSDELKEGAVGYHVGVSCAHFLLCASKTHTTRQSNHLHSSAAAPAHCYSQPFIVGQQHQRHSGGEADRRWHICPRRASANVEQQSSPSAGSTPGRSAPDGGALFSPFLVSSC